MDRVLLVLDEPRASPETLRLLRAATGAPLSTLVARARARLPVMEARLSGNDHQAQAARLLDLLASLDAAGVGTQVYEVDDGVPFDAMPDAWRPQARLDRRVLANRLAARERESHRLAMLAEHERFSPDDPPTEVVPIEAVAADGSTLALAARAATVPPWCLHVSGPGLGPVEACAADLFEALAAVRRALEPQGVRLMCQGARRDVHPSAMARQMGGRLAYALTPGRPARREDLVDILGPLSPHERALVATVDEQAEQGRRWAASIAALPD